MKRILFFLFLLIIGSLVFISLRYYSPAQRYTIGQAIDSLHGVIVYYNGSVKNVSGRNLAPDGYNLGLKYQCVEFVKRYYYEHYQHKMPDTYGHAKDFFNQSLRDGALNTRRGLLQFTNPSATPPQQGDLVVYGPTHWNKFGHVAIISKVDNNSVEVIQQNAGGTPSTRGTFRLRRHHDSWEIKNNRILGWLRLPE